MIFKHEKYLKRTTTLIGFLRGRIESKISRP